MKMWLCCMIDPESRRGSTVFNPVYHITVTVEEENLRRTAVFFPRYYIEKGAWDPNKALNCQHSSVSVAFILYRCIGSTF